MTFGIMFHHFWDGKKKASVGAITSEQLEKIIFIYGLDNILPAGEWFENAINGSLKVNQVCMTFDDALRSQIDLALPVLEKYGLTAFWFIYSSVFEGQASKFEIYRHFSTVEFNSFEQFFEAFILHFRQSEYEELLNSGKQAFINSDYLKKYSFYSTKEREFRFFRDKILGRERFELLMEGMLAASEVSLEELAKGLWMDNDDLVDLSKKEHIIGLHSYSHPTDLSALSYVDQHDEYEKNYRHIKKITGRRPRVVAHPVNSYEPQTLDLLDAMGVKVGFRSNMFKTDFSYLEYPREDCANVIRKFEADVIQRGVS